MKPSEELMLFLELNGFDLLKYRLKKQLEFEEENKLSKYKYKSIEELLLDYYSDHEKEDLLKQNPLKYKDSYPKEIKSLDQFYVSHLDLERSVPLKEFLEDDQFNDIQKESILYDIFDKWIDEYRESSTVHMENLKNMIKLLPKKSKRYKVPSRFAMILVILMMLFVGLVYKSPDTLKSALFANLYYVARDFNLALYYSNWFSFVGMITFLVQTVTMVAYFFVGSYIRDVRSEKNKNALKMFDKWLTKIQNIRLNQSGYLEDYVDQVLNKKEKGTFFDITKLGGPETQLNKYKYYVLDVERKFDLMTKYYDKVKGWLRLLFLASIFMTIVFIIVGLSVAQGGV